MNYRRRNDQPASGWIPFTPRLAAKGAGFGWALIALIMGGLFFINRPHAQAIQPVQQQTVRDAKWDAMVANIMEMVAGYRGDVGLYIKDLKTGRTFEHNARESFVTASLIKLPIMAATFEAINEGRVSFAEDLTFRRNLRRGGSGSLKWAAHVGAKYPISYLVYQMITKSDNTATAMMIQLLGYDYLNARFADFGLSETRIGPVGMTLADQLSDPSQDNYTNAYEMGTLLEKIYRRELVSPGMSDLMMEILKGANAHSRLGRYLPADFKLARKTGTLRKNCHDVGIVFAPGGDYIVCVLTGQNPSYRSARGLIAKVGQKTYEYFGGIATESSHT